jgi:hypothetical protein
VTAQEPFPASKRWHAALAIGGAAALFCWVALWNGYPLLFADSSSYIRMAPEHFRAFARPVFYSFFLWPLHGGVSLWPVAAAQSLLVAHLLWLTLRVAWGGVSPPRFLTMAALLAVATALPWLTGQVMPDVFTGVVVLGLYLLSVGAGRLARWERLYLLALTAGAIACHLSHIPLALALLPVLAGCLLMSGASLRGTLRATGLAAVPLALAVTAHVGTNVALGKGLRLSESSGIFLLARGIADGPTRDYLAAACPQAGYRLCAVVDRLPDDSDRFLWKMPGMAQPSMLSELGGPYVLQDEAATVIRRSWMRAPGAHLQALWRNAARQFAEARPGDGLWAVPGGADDLMKDRVTYAIGRHFPQEMRAYLASRQVTGRLDAPRLATIVQAATWAGLAWAGLAAWLHARRGECRPVLLLGVIVAGALANAVVTGGLSSVHDRYQARIAWLFVFYAAGATAAMLRPTAQRGPNARRKVSTAWATSASISASVGAGTTLHSRALNK